MKLNSFKLLAILVLIVSVFFLRGQTFKDPDFWWHMKFGQIAVNTGIPKTDPFSYTMPSFGYVNHEWLTDYLSYPLFNTFGYLWLAVFYIALFVVLVFIILRDFRKKDDARIAGMIYVFAPLLGYFGVRPMVITWTLFAFLYFVLRNRRFYLRARMLLPLLFLVWANLHGGFVAGLLLLAFYIGFNFLEKRRVEWIDILIFVLSVFATLVNPYGIRLWGEVFSSIRDSSLRYRVSEWMPFLMSPTLTVVPLVSLQVVFLRRYWGKYSWFEKFVVIFFFVEAFLSNRNIPFWAIVSVPIITGGIGFFVSELGKVKDGERRYLVAGKFMLVVALFFMAAVSVFDYRGYRSFNEREFYPRGALGVRDSYEGRVFTDYGWGGYLTWNLPWYRGYIDGRMPSWRNADSPQNESFSAMDDYFDLISGDKDIFAEFEKYGVGTVIWSSSEPPAIDGFVAGVEQKFKRVFFGKKAARLSIDLVRELKGLGWKEIYRDNVSVVLVEK